MPEHNLRREFKTHCYTNNESSTQIKSQLRNYVDNTLNVCINLLHKVLILKF